MSAQDIPLTCFEDIIGLSRTTCPCYDLNIYDTSKSDLYLDELQGLNLKMLASLENCEDSDNIWVIMGRAVDNALLTIINDINQQLMQKYKMKRQPFNGIIGRKKYTQDRVLSNTYAGVRWYCADIVSGSLKIKKIYTLFNQTGTIDLLIYNNSNELLHTVTLSTQANTTKENILSTVIDLPAHDGFVENAEYFFVYQVTPGFYPKNNDIECMTGCSGFNYRFDCNHPYFYTQSNKKKGWADYIMSGSWSGSTLTDFDDAGTNTDGHMNGLMFDVEFGCNVNEVICMDTLNFTNNTMAITLAFMTQFKAGELLLSDWMMNDKLERFSMINAEQANGLIGFYQQKYDSYLNLIMQQININANDCFDCKDFIQMTKRGLLA